MAFLKVLDRTPQLFVVDIGAVVADYYRAKPSRAGGLQVTQAAWSTDSAEVSQALAELATVYERESRSRAGNYNLVADLFSAQAQSTFYARHTEDPEERTSWMDVGEFLANHTRTGGADVAAAAEQVRGALERLRVAHRADGRPDDVMGMSIYFPINRVGSNSGATDDSSRSVATDARLLQGGYSRLLKLVDGQDASSLVSVLAQDDAQKPTLQIAVTGVSAAELTLDVQASDDVMLVSGQAVLLYQTDAGDKLAVVSSSPGNIGVKDYQVEGSLPLTAVLLGPDGVTPSSSSVGFLQRVHGESSVPVAARQGSREERGLLLLADDHEIIGLAVQSANGNWPVLAWSDVVAAPQVEIAPLWYTVDPASGEYGTNLGAFTNAADITAHFLELADTTRLSVAVSVTDIAGNTTLASAALP